MRSVWGERAHMMLRTKTLSHKNVIQNRLPTCPYAPARTAPACGAVPAKGRAAAMPAGGNDPRGPLRREGCGCRCGTRGFRGSCVDMFFWGRGGAEEVGMDGTDRRLTPFHFFRAETLKSIKGHHTHDDVHTVNQSIPLPRTAVSHLALRARVQSP